jgi:hypothetical protein
MPKILPALAGVSRFSVGKLLRKPALLACASVALMAVAPASSRADAVGAAFGALDLSSPDLREQSSAAWSVPCGDTRFGDLQTVRTLVGSIIPFTGIAGITMDGGITIERLGEHRSVCQSTSKYRHLHRQRAATASCQFMKRRDGICGHRLKLALNDACAHQIKQSCPR